MGWSFSTAWRTRKDLISELTETEKSAERTRTSLAHCLRGNVLWSVWAITYTDERPTRRYIGCDLLQNGGKDEGWGYKDMCEAVHPYYYTCPLKYLDMVPEVASPDWRAEVIKQHAIRNTRLEVGMIVGLAGCVIPAVWITQVRPSVQGRSRDGHLFRIRRSHLSGDIFETWPEEA